MSFVHLHTHSEYSLLDGANRIGDLVRRTAELEMPALALTDHGCMFGAWAFQQQAKKADLKPILGMEAYVAPGDRRARGPKAMVESDAPGPVASRTDGAVGDGGRRRDGGRKGWEPTPANGRAHGAENGVARDEKYYHLVLLARDEVGYRNIVKLTSIGYLEGFYHRPRIDREVLSRHADGVIVTSACMAGEVARHLMADRWDAAREAAAWYAGLFEGRYYLEVQAHDTPGQRELNDNVFKLAAELGLPVVATNDAHFLREQDHPAHDVLLCIGLGKDLDDPDRMRYDRGLYFRSPAEIAEQFPERPDVLENTLAIAESVDVPTRKQYHVPSFPLPPDATDEATLLRKLTFERAHTRAGDPLPEAWRERLEYELGVITNPEADYSGYFLITQDFINWAKDRGIPVGPGRGSASGSLVAYVLGITDVDPLHFDLLFERFLNPDRVSMPDIDVDFCYERRGEVIDYVREKYGRDSVGQIITFGTMKARAVIRDVGRALGFEPSETDRLAKLIPNAPNYSLSVTEAIERIPELRAMVDSEPRIAQLLEHAQVLEGLSRHASVHAAGVVIAPGPLDDYVPVCTQPATRGSDDNDDRLVVTQWDMVALEQAGMLKMDFLGLKTLTVIHDAVEWVRRRHGALRHPDTGATHDRIEDVPLDDPPVYEMLAHGATGGVFQFESSLATDKLRAMRCDRFEDLVATNALIRPGPLDSGMTDVYIRRKLGREQVSYAHPALEDVLTSTFGVITYQEQVMRVAQVLAGFSLAEADVLRKAVGKKDAELIQQQLTSFVERAVANHVDPRIADNIAEQIVTFGRYGFPRAHSVTYAWLSYQTAWLKRHYPAEFMAALLSSVVDKTDSVVHYISECRELGRTMARAAPNGPVRGIQVLPPDVNESDWKFTPVAADQIRFGLGALRGLGEAAVRSILDARREDGPFRSLFDLVERVDLRVVGKRSLEALVLGGACDAFGHRAQLLAALEMVMREAQLRQDERESGQASLFDVGDAPELESRPEPQLPDVPRWTESDRLAREKEILGFFISGHPLDRYRDIVRVYQHVTTSMLKQHRDRKIELACVVTSVARQVSKRNGSEWGRITVEDFSGTATVLAFGDAWEGYHDLLSQDAPVLIRGSVSGRDRDEEDPPIFLDSAVPLASLGANGTLAVEVRLEADASPDALKEARAAFGSHTGDAAVIVSWSHTPDDDVARLRSRSLRVTPSNELLDALRSIFGPDRIRLVKA